MSEENRALSILEQRLQESREECQRLSAQMNESRMNVRKGVLAELSAVRNQYKAAERAHGEAAAELQRRVDNLRVCPFSDREPEKLRADAKRDIGKLAELKACAERKNSAAASVILMAAALLCVVIALLLTGLETAVPTLIAAGTAAVLAIAGAVCLFLRKKRVAESEKAAVDRIKLLKGYGVKDERELKNRVDEYLELYSLYVDAYKTGQRTAEELETCRVRLQKAEAENLGKLNFTGGDTASAELTRQYNEAVEKCKSLERLIEAMKRA